MIRRTVVPASITSIPSALIPRALLVGALLLGAALVQPIGLAPSAFAQETPPVRTPPDPLGPEVRELMARQDELTDAGDLVTLVSEARARVEKDGRPHSWYLLGRALGNSAVRTRVAEQAEGPSEEFSEQIAQAREAFDKAREVGGLLFAPAHLGLARCARYEDDPDEAIHQLERALKIQPGYKEAVLELATVYVYKGVFQQADFVLAGFLREYPRDIDARLLQGTLYMRRKRWERAEDEFRQVVLLDPSHVPAQKALATALMFQRKHEEATERFENVLRADPESDDTYITLFHLYLEQQRTDDAKRILRSLMTQFPGSEAAERAKATLAQLEADPDSLQLEEVDPRETAIVQLGSEDEEVVLQALRNVMTLDWGGRLPEQVYRLLSPKVASSAVRRLAVRVISGLEDERHLPLLEIILFHPEERDPDIGVRREAARALAKIPSEAVVPLLFLAIRSPATDPEVREWAVRGIAAVTGKYFRVDLDVATPEADWPAEREQYQRWWQTPTASIAKRKAVERFKLLFGNARSGRLRLAEYAVIAMEDPSESTWRAGYDLFIDLTATTFGSESGRVDEETRTRITAETRRWLAAELGEQR